ncbi:MAG TPA: high-potential iron-sulfur protein [Gammaproteobacteria bacterium]|nr:high-potential iron-sulfur protein [Gammaproteobacteria bacterium]
MLKRGIVGAAAVLTTAAGLRAHAQQGQEAAQKVLPTDPLAQALKYTEDATTAPSDLRKPDSFCHNCHFFMGKGQTGVGPCQVFQGKLVDAKGWCSSWTLKEQ